MIALVFKKRKSHPYFPQDQGEFFLSSRVGQDLLWLGGVQRDPGQDQSQKSNEQRREKEEKLKNQMSRRENEKKTSKDWQFLVETVAVALSPGLRCCTSGSRSPGRLFALVG